MGTRQLELNHNTAFNNLGSNRYAEFMNVINHLENLKKMAQDLKETLIDKVNREINMEETDFLYLSEYVGNLKQWAFTSLERLEEELKFQGSGLPTNKVSILDFPENCPVDTKIKDQFEDYLVHKEFGAFDAT